MPGEPLTPAVDSDYTDWILAAWAATRPDLDLSGRHVIWRIQIVAKHLHQVIGGIATRDAGISDSGASLLMHLRMLPAPHRASPTDLSQRLTLTSGSMTSLIDRMEARGYVARKPDPDDRRGIRVGLTASGLAVADELHETYVRIEAQLLDALDQDERATLANLLRKLTSSYEL